MNIPELIKEAHDNAVRIKAYDCDDCQGIGHMMDGEKCKWCKGTGKSAKNNVLEKLEEEINEFMNSEPSDIFDKDSEQSEICDIILVVLGYAKEMGYDIEKAIIEKMAYNKTRLHKHGKEY